MLLMNIILENYLYLLVDCK
uniref:Uncharacterized protein n=1 Tax=Wuchereria bancrofti TaxID=6293 RepID=A0AAF5PY08_WUCBA